MTLRYDFYNRIYDDAEPVFIYAYNTSMVYDRLAHKEVSTASLMAVTAAAGYTLAAPEIGMGSTAWLIANDFPGEDGISPAPPVVLKPIAALVTLARGTITEITVSGGPADKAYNVKVKVSTSASLVDDIHDVAVAKGDTAPQVAAAIAAAIADPNVTVSIVSNRLVRIIPTPGETMSAVAVTVT